MLYGTFLPHDLLYYVRCSPAYGVPARPTCLFCALAWMAVAGEILLLRKGDRYILYQFIQYEKEKIK